MSDPPHGAPTAGPRRRLRAATPLLALLLFVLAVAWTYRDLAGTDAAQTAPLSTVFAYGTSRGGTEGSRISKVPDQRFVIWVLARNAKTWLEAPGRIFDAEICHPAPMSLALGEPVLTLGLLAIPAWLLAGDPIVTFNFVVMVLPLISALAMYWLVYEWTSSHAAGTVAGVVYAFHMVKIADVVHPYTSDTAWTVFALAFCKRWLERGRLVDALGLAISIALQVGGSLYPLLGAAIVGLAVGGAAAWHFGLSRTRPLQWGVLVAIVLAALYFAFGPFLAKSSSDMLAARTTQVFMPWQSLLPGRNAFPGLAILLLGGLAFLPASRRERGSTWSPHWPLFGAGIVILVLASGGNAGDRLVAELAGRPVPPALPNPYQWLAAVVPGLDLVRAPVYVATSSHLVMASLTGLGAARLLERVPAAWSARAAVALVAVVALYTLRIGLPGAHRYEPRAMRPPPPLLEFWARLEDAGNTGPVLELPVDVAGLDFGSLSVLASAYHHRRTSRCYNSNVSADVRATWDLARGLPDPDVIEGLTAKGFTTVVVHHRGAKRSMRGLLERIDATAGRPGAALRLVHRDRARSAYALLPSADDRTP